MSSRYAALGELTVRWTGGDEDTFEIDEFEGAPPEEPAAAADEPDEPDDADKPDGRDEPEQETDDD